jgi:hypothetical protein
MIPTMTPKKTNHCFLKSHGPNLWVVRFFGFHKASGESLIAAGFTSFEKEKCPAFMAKNVNGCFYGDDHTLTRCCDDSKGDRLQGKTQIASNIVIQ